MVKIELDVVGCRLKSQFNDLVKQVSSNLLEIPSEEDRRNFTSALEKTARVFSAETGNYRDGRGSLIEPLKMTFARQFRKG